MRSFRIKYITAIVLSVFLVWACDETGITDVQQESFLKFYGTGTQDEGMKVIATTDGYLVMGNIDNPGRGKDICVIQTDKFGNSSGSIKAYGGLWNDIGYAIKPNNQGYIIAGSTQETEYSDKDVYLIQIDKQGDTLWTKSYDGTGLDDEAYDFLILGDSNLVVTGYTQNNNGSKINKDFLFLETDAEGLEPIFKSTGLLEDEAANSIVQSDDGYLFAGYNYNLNYTSGEYTKSLLVFRWSETSPWRPYTHSLGIASEAKSIIQINDNEYIVACMVQLTLSNATNIYLLKMDASGHYLWEKEFGKYTLNSVSGLAIHEDALYAVGTSGESEIKGNILILRTDLSGNNPTYFDFGDGTSYTGNGFDFTSDGGFIITGANYLNNNSVIALLKLNKQGLLR
jgi:hypothetical protein